MINIPGFYVTTMTISEAWYMLLRNVLPEQGATYRQAIQRGSYQDEQIRHQYAAVAIQIERPWENMVPEIPAHLGMPAPTTQQYIEEYFANYLMNPYDLKENEQYTYASRIHFPFNNPQHSKCQVQGTQYKALIEMLRTTPLTNQAVLEIASPIDIELKDPPCLRLLDFKVIPIDDKMILTVTCYFRSWDLWAGLPTNLGGIELLKQLIASECGLDNGPMWAYSAGLHIYGHCEDVARIRTHQEKQGG